MSTTYGAEQGTVYVLDEADAVRKKVRSAVTDSGTEVRRGPDKAGIANLIEIISVVRGVAPEQVEGEFEGSGYGDFKAAVAERWSTTWPRSGSATRSFAPTRRAGGDPGRRGREGPRDRLPDGRGRSRRDGHWPVAEPSRGRVYRFGTMAMSRRARSRPGRLRGAVRPPDGGRCARR